MAANIAVVAGTFLASLLAVAIVVRLTEGRDKKRRKARD